MVIGYVLQQLHVTNDSFVKTLNSFNYKITLPVLLFKDMSTADFYSVWDTGYVLFCFFVTRNTGIVAFKLNNSCSMGIVCLSVIGSGI